MIYPHCAVQTTIDDDSDDHDDGFDDNDDEIHFRFAEE